MPADEPDIAALFAPVDATAAVLGVLDEAEAALAGLSDPVDAELWGSDVIGALAATAPPGGQEGPGPAADQHAMSVLATTLVPAAERAASPAALAVLRILAVLGDPALRAVAAQAAERLARRGIPDPAWAAGLGDPEPRACWHYADVGGRQESVTLTFGYGAREHAISVLIDHVHDGKLKDVWLSKGQDQLLSAELAASTDPLIVFEPLAPSEAASRVRQSLSAGESPEQPDQADDICAHRALLRARLAAR